MRKILLSVLVVGAVGGTVFAATNAFFSSTQTSTGNTFTAGKLDLKVDSQCHYFTQNFGEITPTDKTCITNGVPFGTWPDPTSLTTEKFFNFADVKPGDYGENTISLHVDNNPAWACFQVSPIVTNGNNGIALAQGLQFFAWADNCNNAFDPGAIGEVNGEKPLFSNGIGSLSDVLSGKVYALADSTNGQSPLDPNVPKQCLGLAWCAGTLTVDQSTGAFKCDGTSLGNAAQGGSVSADLSFYIEQSRNNPKFSCANIQHTLLLYTENGSTNPWTTVGDAKGTLTWNGDGPNFDYTFKAKDLLNNTQYSLIYAPDPWPQNISGGTDANFNTVIGTFTSDGSGNIALTSGSPDLHFSIPDPSDTNKVAHSGGKIWLVLSADHDGTKMTAWNPSSYLFEGNVYINYTDTNN